MRIDDKADLADLIDRFSPAPSDSDAAAIMGDLDAMRVLAGWRRTMSEWTKPRWPAPDPPAQFWGWLWSGVKYDRAQLARIARVSEERAHVLLHLCADAGLARPDGTISDPGERLIVGALRKRAQAAKRRESTTTDD